MSKIDFSEIEIGQVYGRPYLAKVWGYKTHFPLSRGVVTPSYSDQIILFVTKENQVSATKYNNYINDGYLYWEGEEKGGNDSRIIAAEQNKDTIHLFYRHKHHTEFFYLGIVKPVSFVKNEDKPSTFIYQIIGNPAFTTSTDEIQPNIISERETERRSLALSRIGQGAFRIHLIKLWGTCAITNVNIPEILKASHIKPWRSSTNIERLDPYNGLLLSPTIDALFDRGFISFEDDGYIIISKQLRKEQELLNIGPHIKLRNVFESSLKYLQHHKTNIFIK
ncbi:HNH endonuclease [Mucilaginibacter sabulilitoris]|uniref:HNH endonuclease n=1 Tax=Mucilaginibacter sabulilitoris TaxID=1173583 RepID=A0ABZ0THJ5_9SPHI|nr:HNH endonuclease [Mucilaginibacter sabulilitoris]WPU92488.1 HNH endonuclease [Mucilaginibacter sabulilitoris]